MGDAGADPIEKRGRPKVSGRSSDATRHSRRGSGDAMQARKPKGWANYFCLGPVSRAYRAVDSHVRQRLGPPFGGLCAKHKVQGRGTARWPDETLYGTLGLVRLERQTRSLPWAKA